MSDFYVLIFSKYSNSSRQIMSIINSLPDFPVNYFSIDHQRNREQILNFQDLQIKSVPCLLKCSSLFGEVKKFEGNDCFNFFNKLKKNQASTTQTQQQIQTPTIVLQTPPPTPNVSNENNNKSKKNHSASKRNRKVIENVDDDIPQNSSNIDEVTISDEEEAEKNDRDFREQILPKSNNDKGNLLAMATAMQKSRMSEDESLKNPKMMPRRI